MSLLPPRERFCLSEHFARVTDCTLDCSRHGSMLKGCPYCRSHVPCTCRLIECKVSVCDYGPLYRFGSSHLSSTYRTLSSSYVHHLSSLCSKRSIRACYKTDIVRPLRDSAHGNYRSTSTSYRF